MHNSIRRRISLSEGVAALISRAQVCLFAFPQIFDLIFLPVNTAEIIKMLRQEGISADRKSIYSDIKALIDYGLDIVSLPGKNGGYYLAYRDFDVAELKVLIDAIQASRFITTKTSKELISKVTKLASETT